MQPFLSCKLVQPLSVLDYLSLQNLPKMINIDISDQLPELVRGWKRQTGVYIYTHISTQPYHLICLDNQAKSSKG